MRGDEPPGVAPKAVKVRRRWQHLGQMRSIATVGLKDCTDRKYVRCCTVLYEDVLRRTKPPTKLQPNSGHWANDSQNLNMSCRLLHTTHGPYIRSALPRSGSISSSSAPLAQSSGQLLFGQQSSWSSARAEDQRSQAGCGILAGPSGGISRSSTLAASTTARCTQAVQTCTYILGSSCGVFAITQRPAHSLPGRTPRVVTF